MMKMLGFRVHAGNSIVLTAPTGYQYVRDPSGRLAQDGSGRYILVPQT